MDRAYRPQLCAFREGSGIAGFEERITKLGGEALADLIGRSAIAVPADQDVDLLIVLPEVAPEQGLTSDRLKEAANALTALAEAALASPELPRLGSSRLFAGGEAGVGWAVNECLNGSDGGGNAGTIVLAVDSYNDRNRMNALNDASRLYIDAQPYGFIPGEAAAAIWLSVEATAAEDGALEISGAGTATELVREFAEDESVLRALSGCCFSAMEHPANLVPQLRCLRWHADWNNSRYRSSELSLAIHRLAKDHLEPGMEPEYPSVALGHVGAAFGAVALTLLFEEKAGAGGRTGRQRSIISAGSTISGLRSAIVADRFVPSG